MRDNLIEQIYYIIVKCPNSVGTVQVLELNLKRSGLGSIISDVLYTDFAALFSLYRFIARNLLFRSNVSEFIYL